jgi:peptidoglycan hydrolase CwlO-like protein
VLAAAALTAGTAGADPPSVASKERQAQDVLAQIQRIDASLGHAVESYNLANVKLDRIERDIEINQRELAVARTNMTRAQSTLSSRVVEIYTTHNRDSTIEIIFGAESLNDLLNRIDAVNRISDQDGRIMGEVNASRTEVVRRRANLRSARTEQAQVVAGREAKKNEIEAQLARREALLSTIRGEIARLRAQEAAQQALLRQRVQAQSSLQASANGGFGIAATSPDGATVAPPSRYGVRLLGFRDVRLCTDRCLAAPQRRGPVRLRRAGVTRSTPARRPRLLQRVGAQRHLRGRKRLHPLTAHGRLRKDLDDQRLVRQHLGRRSPPVARNSGHAPVALGRRRWGDIPRTPSSL